nr:cytochrome P450 [uncultured Halomonas sp.]
MAGIPHDPGLDNSLALLKEGYTFISSRCARYRSDIFTTRLMLKTAYCVLGEDAARMFYHPGRFTRQGAMPPITMRLLQDKGSVQPLDGDAHRHRKQLFMEMMTPEQMQRLHTIATSQWQQAIERWQRDDEIVLMNAARELLCRIACAWADVPLNATQAQKRTREFAAMLDGAASVGPRSWRGLWLRRHTERWAEEIIRQIRKDELLPADGSPAALIAYHRDRQGRWLDENDAAVELLNVLRPIVAVGRFIAYAALALHDYPQARESLHGGGEAARRAFAQEVRRFYPFFPMIGGRVREPFEWRDHRFAHGDWVLLDIYGTNHDPRSWEAPDAFRPERFASGNDAGYAFIPQGGGDLYNGHRCPGEGVAVALIEIAIDKLTSAMTYDVPRQNLAVDLSDLPAAPKDRFRIRNVVARD